MPSSRGSKAVRDLQIGSIPKVDPVESNPRIGLFGRLGSGNIGNDATLEAVLAYLNDRHPDAVLDCMCSGPNRVRARYHLEATELHWFHRSVRARRRLARVASTAILVAAGIVVDAYRTGVWVRRHSAVIVPGMGVLESTLPQRPWQLPYSMCLLSLFGRVFGTQVVLLCVGVSGMRPGMNRWLLTAAARRAHYRSFRDTYSLDEARRLGIAGPDDEVYLDLVFSLPDPPSVRGNGRKVGVGVMAYSGASNDSGSAIRTRTEYVDGMLRFVQWLIDTGHQVRLLIGDEDDESVVQTILAEVRSCRGNSDSPPIVYQPISTIEDLMSQVASLDVVVATRYHNVLVALKSSKPTLSIGYGQKHRALMTRAGLGRFTHPIDQFDIDELKRQFTELSAKRDQVSHALDTHNARNRVRLEDQFNRLTDILTVESAGRAAGRGR